MVSHERSTAVVTNDLKAKRSNQVSACEDVDPPQKKPQRPGEVPEEATWEVSVFTHSADQVQCVRDFFEAPAICDAGKKNLGDWLIELFNIGSQPAGAFQEHEDAPPPETKEKYEDLPSRHSANRDQ